LGFCKKGEAVKLLKEKKTQFGGKGSLQREWRTSGKGTHPVGCTGIAQIVEAVWQLRVRLEEAGGHMQGWP